MRDKFEMLSYFTAVAVSIGLLTGLAIYQGKVRASERRNLPDTKYIDSAPVPRDAENRKNVYERLDIKR